LTSKSARLSISLLLTTGVIYGLAKRKLLALAGKDAGAKKLKLKLAYPEVF